MKRKLLLSLLCTMAVLLSAAAGTTKLGALRKTVWVEAFAKKRLLQANDLKTKTHRSAVLATLPYFYSFETPTISSDGWLITDNDPNLSKATTIVNAPYGNYVLFSQYSSLAPRNMWAFSPSFALTAGTPYFVSIYVYAPGYNGAKDEFKITVGSDQTESSQTTVLIDKSGANATTYSNWTLLQGSFTPSADGNYYFGINHGTSVADVNFVQFDAFAVNQGTPIVYPPSAKIYTWNGGLWSTTSDNNQIYLSPQEPLTYTAVNASNTNSYSWSFADATPANSADPQVTVVYDLDGSKSAGLQLTGNGGTTNLSSDLQVVRPHDGVSDFVWNVTPSEGLDSYTFSDFNYLLGLNDYYKRVSEKYTLPNNVSVTLNSINFYVAKYALAPENIDKDVAIRVYSVANDGLPGTVLNSYTTSFSALFGNSAISTSTIKNFALPTPLVITGSFFIEIDFSAFTSATGSTNFLGLYSSSNRISYLKYNTAYIYMDNKWSSTTEAASATISAGIAPSLSFQTPSTSSIGGNLDSKQNVRFSDGKLYVSNVPVGNQVRVFDLSGKLLFDATTAQETQAYPLSLGKGVYLVKAGVETTKLLVY